jgi:hypothetical protein
VTGFGLKSSWGIRCKLMGRGLEALIEAGKILDAHNVPKGHRSAWMLPNVFFALGGTLKQWLSTPGPHEGPKFFTEENQ